MSNLTFDVPMVINSVERLLTVNYNYYTDYDGTVEEIILQSVETVLLDNKTVIDYMTIPHMLTSKQWDELGELAYKHVNDTVMIL